MEAKFCSSFMRSQYEIVSKTNVLYEGLITSYPINELLRILSNKIDKKTYKVEFILNYNIALPYIKIILSEKELEKDVIQLFKVGGWEVADKKIDSKISLVFRAKFDTKIDKKYWPDFLYHITPLKNLKKIMKKGLIPKSHNKLLKHEDAIYLYNSDNIEELQNMAIEILYKQSDHKEFAILEIDLRKKKNIDNPILTDRIFRLYSDPDMSNAFFTMENISPDEIKVIKIFTVGGQVG